jgi:hypothetical protein
MLELQTGSVLKTLQKLDLVLRIDVTRLRRVLSGSATNCGKIQCKIIDL